MPETFRTRYKSPLHKVLNMLERGRDNWKTKYCEAKLQIKYLKNKLRRIEQSQQNWKQKAQASAVEVKYLQAAIEQHKQREEGDKKNRVASPKSNANRKSSKSYVLNRSCIVVSQPRFDWRKWFAHSVKKLNSSDEFSWYVVECPKLG